MQARLVSTDTMNAFFIVFAMMNNTLFTLVLQSNTVIQLHSFLSEFIAMADSKSDLEIGESDWRKASEAIRIPSTEEFAVAFEEALVHLDVSSTQVEQLDRTLVRVGFSRRVDEGLFKDVFLNRVAATALLDALAGGVEQGL
jgi:hypothetical protein